MEKNDSKRNKTDKILCFLLMAFLCIGLASCQKRDQTSPIGESEEITENDAVDESEETVPQEEPVPEAKYTIEIVDDGEILYQTSSDYYRYGPSIIKYEDGSMDAWFSSPGNSGSQWDWIRYIHSDDGINWSEEEIVFKPTPGSKDRCSVCDPGVIYFGGYYYLGYTSTDYYEGDGLYNMAFVARSEYPNGPFEKWNGSGWGGDPEPIIYYDGGKDYWGIGNVSFVIYDNDLCIYYSYIDLRDSYIGLYKADLVNDWPSTMRNKGPVLYRLEQDSVEVVYDENNQTFYAFSIDGRMMEGSEMVVFESHSGKDFSQIGAIKEHVKDYAHNMGVAKSTEGWINTNDEFMVGYAYGKDWGRWKTIFQKMTIKKETE